MKNRIDDVFSKLKADGKKAFIPFITAGDPTLEITRSLILKLESVGADIIELGVPFSDPIADGPSIQRASLRALENNTSLRDVIRLVSEVRKETQIPIVVMGYYNPIYKYGVKKFAKVAVEAGIDGAVIADLPPEEASDLIEQSRQNGLSTIFLIAPTSTPERVKLIAEASTGYIYCVSTTGVTGARNEISDMLIPTVSLIRQSTDKPIAVGFGVSTPEQAYEVAKLADGVIVGSAIVNIIEKHKDNIDEILNAVGDFASSLVEAIKK
ncbi:MAG: tryptophan synthase subunit alpha [Candidatus Poribacteria bacterium]